MRTGKGSEIRLIWQGLMPLLLIILVVWLVNRSGWFSQFDNAWLETRGNLHNPGGYLWFVIVLGLLAAVGMPRQLVAFSGGYVYGTVTGTLVSTIAVTCGALVSFYVARLLLSATMSRRLYNRYPALGRFLQQDTFRKTLTIRFFPVGNNLVTNVIAGSSGAPPLPFFLGSFLGYLPQMIIFALTGSGVSVGSEAHMIAGVVLFCLATVLSVRIYRSSSACQALEEDDPMNSRQ